MFIEYYDAASAGKLEGNGPIDSRAKVMMSDGNFVLGFLKSRINS